MEKIKKFKKLTENERIELSNLEFFYKYNIGALRGKDVVRMQKLQEHREKEDELKREKDRFNLRDKAYKWF